jgi:glutaredoxin
MITVYTKPNCPYCTIAKQYLEKNEFEFETVDITENNEAREFLLAEGHRTMPQIYHNGKLLIEGGGMALNRLQPQYVRELIGDIDLDVGDFKL